MAVQLASILNGQQFFDNEGNPLAGGLIYVYISGTTTPVNTWSNAAGSVLNTNPLVLDSSGRLQTEIWITASTLVKFRLTDFASTVLEEWNDIGGIITGLSISQSDVITALGYVPVNVAGDTMLGQLVLNGNPTSSLMAATKQYVDTAITAIQAAVTAQLDAALSTFKIEPGSIFSYGAATAPAGYLLCDGAPVSRTTYADLFAIIGTNYGLGDSTTTFNLPDFRGRFQRGIDSGAGRDPGRVFNAATGSSQADDFFAHDHVSYVPADETYNDGLSLYNPLYTGSPGHAQWTTIGEDGDKKNTFLMVTSTISQIPAPANHPGTETRPKNVIVQYIIKT